MTRVSFSDQLPPLHILPEDCSPRSPELSPPSGSWKIYGKGEKPKWGPLLEGKERQELC